MLNVPQYLAGLARGFWRGWYRQYAKAAGPAQIELMKQRSAWAKLFGLRR